MIAVRIRNFSLYVGLGLVLYFALCLLGHAVHAGVVVDAPGPVIAQSGWSVGEVMALVALVIASVGMVVDGVRALLHFTAPRTKTKLDDEWADRFDDLHDKIDELRSVIPNAKPQQAAPIALAPAKDVAP